MKKLLLLLVVFLALAVLVPIIAQQRTVIHIERARKADYDVRLGRDIQRLIGNVVLRQDSTWFYCDSAYLNEKTRHFEAFGNVHIAVSDSLNIYSDRLKYNSETRVAELFDNVRLIDNKSVLTTEYLIYNRITQLATYPNHGIITNEDNVLKSRKGYYQTNLKEFYFREDVELISPDYTAYSDTLVYNNETEIAWFYGPTIIRGEENTIYLELGWYDTRRDQAHLFKRALITTMEQTFTADTIFYDRSTGYGEGLGKVVITDTTNNMIVMGGKARMWEDEGRSYVTGRALAVNYEQKDSLFIHADTLFLYFDDDRNAKSMLAYYHVKMFRDDLQGKCDSLVYHMADSTIRMYKKPVLWSDENQLTADSIHMAVVNKQIDSLVLYNSAFIISKDSIEGFNQIKGKDMVGYFKNGELVRVRVDGNAQTVYWVREEDKSLIGINLAVSSTMMIFLEDNQMVGITYKHQPKEVMYPKPDLPEAERKLRGFVWLEEWRPRKKEDIFIWQPEGLSPSDPPPVNDDRGRRPRQ
jgi:lipopolysaccharide export system protein LptA